MFGKRNKSNHRLKNAQGENKNRGKGRRMGMEFGARNSTVQPISTDTNTDMQNQMKVAIVTNNGTTVAKHIGLAKKIAFYQFPEGKLIKTVDNPIMKKIKDENIKLDKAQEGNRHLNVGHLIPQFLIQNGVNAFVTYEFGKGIKDNLLELGITPVVPESHNIGEIIQMMKKQIY